MAKVVGTADWRDRIIPQEGIGTLQLGPQAYIDPRDQRYVHDAYQYFLDEAGQRAAAETAAPVVQDPTTMIPQTGGEGGAGITAASVVQPTDGGAQNPLTQMITDPVTGQTQTVKQAMTSNQAYAIPGQMPKTPVSGAWGPMDYLQDETVTPPITDQAGAVAAITPPEAYNIPGQSDPFLASGAAGGARLPATQATTTLPSGDVLATDDPMLQEKMDYTEKTPAQWEVLRDKFIETGQDVGNIFTGLKNKGIDVGKMVGTSILNYVTKGLTGGLPILGTVMGMLPKETSEDTWNKQFQVGGKGFQDIATSDPDLGKRLEGYSKDLIAGTGGNKDPFGRNTVSMFGDYEKRLAEDLQYTGDSQFNLDKKAYAQAYFDKKGIADNPNEAKAFEEKYGISPTGAPVTRDRLIDEGIAAADEEDDMFEPTTIDQLEGVDPGFKSRLLRGGKGPGEISGVAGTTIVDPDRIADSTVKVGRGAMGTIDRTEPTVPVTGVEGPPSILSPEIYQDPIMDIADDRRALQEELEAYRDPIMDMEPAESVDLGNPLGDPRIVSEEQGLAGDPWLGYEDPIMGMVEPTALDLAKGDPVYDERLGWIDPVTEEPVADPYAIGSITGASALVDKAQKQLEKIEALENSDAYEYLSEEQKEQLKKDKQKIQEELDITPTITPVSLNTIDTGGDDMDFDIDSVTTAKGPPSVISRPTFEPRGGGADRDPAPAPKSTPSFDPGGYGDQSGGGGEFDTTPSAPTGISGPPGRGGSSGGPPSQGGGGGGGGGGCFLKGTQVTMADGSTKAIEQVDLGDKVAKGGKVFATGKFLVENLHDYKGIKVSGSLMVNEDGNWTRVEDSKHGKPLGDDEHTVYVFGAENRRILINNILFTDYFEVKEQEKLSEGDKFFDNWKLHAKVDSDNNVNILNAS